MRRHTAAHGIAARDSPAWFAAAAANSAAAAAATLARCVRLGLAGQVGWNEKDPVSKTKVSDFTHKTM